MVVRHHSLYDSIMSDCDLVLTSKFWLLLCYLLRIKQKLSTVFYSSINSLIEKQNSIVESYLRVFINHNQNDWARLLLMVQFAYIII